MKRTVKLSLGMSFIMLALVLIAPHLASPNLVLRFLPKDVYEAGKDHPAPSLPKQLLCHLLLAMAAVYIVWAYKDVADGVAAGLLFYGFGMPSYMLLIVFWLPMMIIQFRAFSKGFTPYPRKARWFCVLIGMIPALVLSAILGLDSTLGSAIGTMFLSFGNAFMFGGLLATLPDQESFDRFQEKISILKSV